MAMLNCQLLIADLQTYAHSGAFPPYGLRCVFFPLPQAATLRCVPRKVSRSQYQHHGLRPVQYGYGGMSIPCTSRLEKIRGCVCCGSVSNFSSSISNHNMKTVVHSQPLFLMRVNSKIANYSRVCCSDSRFVCWEGGSALSLCSNAGACECRLLVIYPRCVWQFTIERNQISHMLVKQVHIS